MRLLVSVRSIEEVDPALAGGADIIDAKEPAHGALGAVSRAVLAGIARAVPVGLPLSIALGDPGAAAVATGLVEEAQRTVGSRDELYLKLGLAGTPGSEEATRVLEAAVAAARSGGRAQVIAVAYADHEAASSPPLPAVTRLARRVGTRGLLLDTYGKTGGLLDYLDERALHAWALDAHDVGLVAVAGSLDRETIAALGDLPIDVLGVRGAACEGGRFGAVSESKVRALKAVLRSSNRLETNTIAS
jgi:uncharacterized protein (UPF0264 family)